MDAVDSQGALFTMPLPYIGFSPLGQLGTNDDEFIPLDRGSVFYATNTVPAHPQ